MIRLILAAWLSCWAIGLSHAGETRVALIIGNNLYEAVPSLKNAARDADVIATSLRQRGFTVQLAVNLGYDAMRRTIRDFATQAARADWAVLYYAGHGIEFGGENFLIPTDAQLKSDTDIAFETVPLTNVLQSLSSARKLHLVILDACRDNPFASRMSRATGTRSLGRGLARIDPEGENALVVFSAKPGQVALDGDGENSPFAAALAKRLAEPVEIRRLFGLVRDDVMSATGARQQPYHSGSLGGEELFFNSVTTEVASTSPPDPTDFPANRKSVKTTTLRLDAVDLALQDARERTGSGNIPAARAILERFKDSGDSRVLVGLAETYDPGIVPDATYADAEQARLLYEAAGRAGFNGSADRVARLSSEPQASDTLPPAAAASTAPTLVQSAVLYEEHLDNPQQQGEAFQGNVTWRIEPASTASNTPLATAVKADIDIPPLKLKGTMTIRKNLDPALPASHTLEIQFHVPADFPGGGIANVPGVLMKQSAQERGTPLQGLSVKVTSAFFLVGLADSPTDEGRNAMLLKERGWIDFPLLYDNGRRAILTLEKGAPGELAFVEAFQAWEEDRSGMESTKSREEPQKPMASPGSGTSAPLIRPRTRVPPAGSIF
jgi:uncharacterized caspase-like protein